MISEVSTSRQRNAKGILLIIGWQLKANCQLVGERGEQIIWNMAAQAFA